MTVKRRRLDALTPTADPTEDPTEGPTEFPSAIPTPYPIYTLYEGDDFVAPPTLEPTLQPSLSPTVNEVGTVTGIAINYNITISASKLGFGTPQEAFDALTAELITAIDNGNFTQALREEGKASSMQLFAEASSSVTDFAIKNYMTMGQPTPVRTKVPTGTPTSSPSALDAPTPAPSKGVTPIIPPRRSTEIVAGVVMVACIFGLLYLTSVLIGCLRAPANFNLKKSVHLKSALSTEYDDQKNYYLQKGAYSLDESKMSSASSIRSGSSSSISVASSAAPHQEENQLSPMQESASTVQTTTEHKEEYHQTLEIESGIPPVTQLTPEVADSVPKKDFHES